MVVCDIERWNKAVNTTHFNRGDKELNNVQNKSARTSAIKNSEFKLNRFEIIDENGLIFYKSFHSEKYVIPVYFQP